MYNKEIVRLGVKSKIIISIVSVAVIITGLFLIFNQNIFNNRDGLNNLSNNDGSIVKTEEKEDDVKMLFATNLERNVYKIKRGDKWVVIIDGQESIAFDEVTNPTFSFDGEQFAYSAYLNSQTYLVINTTLQLTPYQQIISIVFSPDGTRLAYVADKGETYVVVLDNKESKEYPEIGILKTENGEEAFVIFSPDGEEIAFKVVTDDGAFIVVGDQEGEVYDDVSDFSFSDTGDGFDYQADDEAGQITVTNETHVVIDTTTNDSSTSDTSTSDTSTSSSATDDSSTSSTSNTSVSSSSSNNDPVTITASEAANAAHYLECDGTSGVSDCY